jgi:hypothetical protein
MTNHVRSHHRRPAAPTPRRQSQPPVSPSVPGRAGQPSPFHPPQPVPPFNPGRAGQPSPLRPPQPVSPFDPGRADQSSPFCPPSQPASPSNAFPFCTPQPASLFTDVNGNVDDSDSFYVDLAASDENDLRPDNMYYSDEAAFHVAESDGLYTNAHSNVNPSRGASPSATNFLPSDPSENNSHLGTVAPEAQRDYHTLLDGMALLLVELIVFCFIYHPFRMTV